jgi:parallel beta-helix repeat protein
MLTKRISMFTRALRSIAVLCLSGAGPVAASVYYVDVNSTNPVVPYSSWATAATNIQDAVNHTINGDLVLVTNGVYQTGGRKSNTADVTNRVMVPNAVTIESVNGPLATIIQGYQPPVGISNASNAVRCAFLGNNAVLAGFTLSGGSAGSGNYINGGGVSCVSPNSVVSNCIVTGNVASGAGGGIYLGSAVNCLIVSNTADAGGGAGTCVLSNCTVVKNAANGPATAPRGGGVDNCTVDNCIIFYNTAVAGGTSNYSGSKFNFSCSAPPPIGTSNIASPPAFVNLATGNFHLQIGSPCIDSGFNGYVAAGTDLDGNPRIVNGTVDMGAYENQNTPPVHYVSLSSTNPVPPYTNWSTAATNIQDAIDVAQAGEIVLAGDGNYKVGGTVAFGVETNRIAITNPVIVLSLSGPASATITGGTQTRCAYVGTNAVLSGFTLTGGQANNSGNVTNDQSGGGAWCETSGLVTNCVIIRNTAFNGRGGGDYGGTVTSSVLSSNSANYGGGAASAKVINCTIMTNSAISQLGGGVYQAVVSNCLIISNSSYFGAGAAELSTLYNCTVAGNSSSAGVGGAGDCTSYNCSFTGNRGSPGGGTRAGTNFNCAFNGNHGFYGGGSYLSTNYNCLLQGNTVDASGGGAYGGVLYNCVLDGNSATNGAGGGIYQANAVNCTIISNFASGGGGGVLGGALYNSIVYYNNSPTGSNYSGTIFMDCCTLPLPNTFSGCFTNAPVFVNPAGGDFHEQTNSPTINGGLNNYVNGSPYPPLPLLTTDFDGNPRIIGGTVDVGAYEYQGSNLGLPVPIPWLVKYNLPTDGSADYLDSDGDGMNNWQEWIAGTDPKNSSSFLQMLAPASSGPNIVVSWNSVAGVPYYIQRATDLGAVPAFQRLVSNIIGHAGTTSYTDTNSVGPGPYYYRIGVNSQ